MRYPTAGLHLDRLVIAFEKSLHTRGAPLKSKHDRTSNRRRLRLAVLLLWNMIRSHDSEQNLADAVSYVAMTSAKRQKLT
ncbi:hypothetical protein CQZ93_25905 [Ochrobactrum vermis]|nr:hypothetical protein CQZ93_25905 [Ochrobactrum vermis]